MPVRRQPVVQETGKMFIVLSATWGEAIKAESEKDCRRSCSGSPAAWWRLRWSSAA